MEIYVLSREMARKRAPDKPELLIGLLDSKPPANTPVILVRSNLRLKYLTYTLDDIDEPYEDYVSISKETAERILKDFSGFKNKIESLAIHCNMGLSRSPAVAAALNDCFSLGKSSEEEFFRWGYRPNALVYRTIIQSAREIGISVKDIGR